MNFKKWVVPLFVASLSLVVCTAQAQDVYPSKPVRIIVGFPPGGSSDMLTRLIAQHLGEAMKQPFVVDNKPGANTIIASDAAARAPADGYTLMVAGSNALTINQWLYTKLPYSPEQDFQPISTLGSFPLVLAAKAALPVKNVQELVDVSQKNNGLTYGTPSVAFQLANEMFAQASGAKLRHIPYKGSGPVLMALVSGEIDTAILDAGAIVSHVKSGKINAIAVTSKQRAALYPNLPTFAEAGMSSYDVQLWIGLFARNGTPPEIVTRIQSEIARIMQMPSVRRQLAEAGIEPGGMGSSAMEKMILEERRHFGGMIRRLQIKAE